MHRFQIEVLVAVAACAFSSAYLSLPIARDALEGSCPRSADSTQLGQSLSKTAMVYYPGSPEFAEASARWSALAAPKPSIVVVPGTEEDVAVAVSFS